MNNNLPVSYYSLVIWLRDKTALPILQCRQAAIDARGDKDLALKLLRERNPMPKI